MARGVIISPNGVRRSLPRGWWNPFISKKRSSRIEKEPMTAFARARRAAVKKAEQLVMAARARRRARHKRSR
jgi:hypothetical protein